MVIRTVVVGLTLAACTIGEPGTTDAPHVITQHVLAKDGEVVLADGETKLSFRAVHMVQSFASGVFAEDGLPYVSVGDSWLELTSSATIANNGFVFRIEKLGCETEQRQREDYGYHAFSSCTIEVDTTETAVASLASPSFTLDLALADRYATSASTSSGTTLVAVRSLGFYVGNVDTSTWEVGSARASLDLVTSFGVANVEIDAAPIIGHEQSFVVGGQPVKLTVLDIANTNTRCDLPLGCRNVFDLRVEADAIGVSVPRVLAYR